MSETQNAQPVTEQKPDSPFPKEEIEKAFNNPLLKSFKKYLDPLLGYFETVETRLQAADKNFQVIASTINKLEPLISLSAQVAQRQTVPQPAQQAQNPMGGLDMGSILQLVTEAMKGTSSSSNDVLQTLAMDSLKADIELSRTMKSAVLSKIAGKAVSQVVDSVPIG